MNSNLRDKWARRFDAASLDPSWQSRIETKVLEFLLSRYPEATSEAAVPERELFHGESPEGRVKAPRTASARSRTLRRITRGNFEPHNTQPPDSQTSLTEQIAYSDLKKRQRKAQRGYW